MKSKKVNEKIRHEIVLRLESLLMVILDDYGIREGSEFRFHGVGLLNKTKYYSTMMRRPPKNNIERADMIRGDMPRYMTIDDFRIKLDKRLPVTQSEIEEVSTIAQLFDFTYKSKYFFT